MCRHLAYMGAPITLENLLVAPIHSLLRQSWAPRMQSHGTLNADGFGAGWWQPSHRREPARYRTTTPMWADPSFASIAGVIEAGAVLAAVRSATPPLPVEASGCAPFTAGPWLFSHNGTVTGWSAGAGVAMRRMVTEERARAIEGASDSEVLFALVLDRIDAGERAPDAVAAVVRSVGADPGGRLNLLLSDGDEIVATTWGDTLFTRSSSDSVIVASEPFDDDEVWCAVPDRSLVHATTGGLTIKELC
jgi:glutamine amidotransferase